MSGRVRVVRLDSLVNSFAPLEVLSLGKELAKPFAQNTVSDGNWARYHFRLVVEILVKHVVDRWGHFLVQRFVKAEFASVNFSFLKSLAIVIIQIFDVEPYVIEGGVPVFVVWGEEAIVGLEADALLFELGGGLVFE